LFGQLIGQLTSDNGVVLDPFAGTGSTALAAARRNRWSTGVEIDPVQLEKASEMLSRSAIDAEIQLNQG
jgi:DNA modification methylase